MEETEKPKIDQHIQQQNNNYGSGCVLVNGGSPTINIYNNGEKTAVAAPSGELPQELQPEEAQALLEKFQNAGKLDENYQPVNLTRAYMAIMANSIAVELNLQHKWSLFENLWGVNALSSAYTRALNQKNSSELIKEIERIIAS